MTTFPTYPVSAMIARTAFALSLLLLVVTGSASAQLTTSSMPRVITVSGEGTVRVAPDQATLRLGVVTEAETAEAARDQNGQAMSRALNAVRERGVPENKIQVQAFRLQPQYEYDQQRRTREQVGYQAVRLVSIEMDDLEMLPTLVAEVVQQGANRLEGIEYGLSDRTSARNEALQEAARNARDKATVLAEALDAAVGPVVQMQEQGFSFPRPFVQADVMMARNQSAEAGPSPDAYAAGEIEVQAQVQVTFELGGAD